MAAGLVRGETRKLFQLVGEMDREHPSRPSPRTFSKCLLYGTDVGAILDFGPGSPIRILFGDSWSSTGPLDEPALRNEGEDFFSAPYNAHRPFNGDAIGIITSTVTADNVHNGVELDFYLADDKGYATLEVPRVDLLTNRVPTGALGTSNGRALVFVTGPPFPVGNPPQAPRSWIAPWTDITKPKTDEAFEFSTGPFANFLCPVIAGQGGVPGADDVGEPVIWLWGTGFPNRNSSVRLARARLRQVTDSPGDRTAWEFFAGLADSGAPRFADERAAVQLFDSSSVGEFSVCWNGFLQRWLMLHGSPNPRGIVCRSARAPWGPWDDGVVIFDPGADHGYGHFIHDPGHDAVSDRGREREFGGEYAPVFVPRYAKGTKGHSTIRYLMSTWNPYTVVMMESQLWTRSGRFAAFTPRWPRSSWTGKRLTLPTGQ